MLPVNLPATALILTETGAQLVALYGGVEYLLYVWPDGVVDNTLWPFIAGKAGEIQTAQVYPVTPRTPYLSIAAPVEGQEFTGLPGTYLIDFMLNRSQTPIKVVLHEQDANNRLELRTEYDGSFYMLKLYRIVAGVPALQRYMSSAVQNNMHVLIQMRTPLQLITASGAGVGFKSYCNGALSAPASSDDPPFAEAIAGRFETLPTGLVTNFRVWEMVL